MDENEVQEGTMQLPMMSRAAPVSSVNVEGRTVDLVWTTGAQVRRYDFVNCRPYLEELSLDPAHVRMGRLHSGAPLLDTHFRLSLHGVLGVVRSAALNGGEGVATVEFSKREEVEPVFQDVVDGIIRNVSAGYIVHAFEFIPPKKDGDLWIYRAIDWEPTELSLVPIGADADAGTRSQDQSQPSANAIGAKHPCKFQTRSFNQPSAAADITHKESEMSKRDDTTSGTDAAQVAQQTDAARNQELEAARAEGMRLEAERQSGIREAVRMGGLDDAYAEQLIGQRDMTAADAGMAVLREKAKRDAAQPTRSQANIRTISDETENRREAIGDAIALRANPRPAFHADAERMERARQYRGMNLMDMARECIEAAGGNTRGLSRREIAGIALNLDSNMMGRAGMSTSDFPEILANTVGRTLRSAYAQQVRTFTGWARQSTAPDFRQVARAALSESSKMQAVKEGGEYKAITFGEGAEKYALGKYGGIVALTWETLINDDLAAFDRIPLMLAAEAAALEGDIVYGILTGNPAMSDGKELFHVDHGNLATSGAAISDTTLGAGRAAIRKQTGLKGRILNLTPDFLIVGPDNETLANKYTSASFVAAKASDVNPNFNTSLEVVVEGRITGNAWHLSTSPGLVDTIEYSYLEGEEGLFTETRQGFEVDGVQIKARHVFAAKAIDYRGLYKNGGQ